MSQYYFSLFARKCFGYRHPGRISRGYIKPGQFRSALPSREATASREKRSSGRNSGGSAKSNTLKMKYADVALAARHKLINLFSCTSVLAVVGAMVLGMPGYAVAALEFFSIKDNAVVMYDAPSLKADKLYVASRNLPVEAVVKVEGWVKVRDSGGTLAWVEEKELSDKRYVIVTAPQAEA